jgi:hypothetical protein
MEVRVQGMAPDAPEENKLTELAVQLGISVVSSTL